MADARVCRRVGSLDDGQHKTNMDGKTHTHASIHSHSTQNTADLKSDKCARRSAQARKEPLRNGGEEASPPATTRCTGSVVLTGMTRLLQIETDGRAVFVH